jgi:hypothetical protein
LKKGVRRIPGPGTAIGIVGLVLSTVAIGQNCSQSADIARQQTQTNALAFRPIFKLLGGVRLDTLQANSTGPEGVASDTLILPFSMELKISAKLRNDGNTRGRLIGYVIGDTVTGSEAFRNILKNENQRKSVLQLIPAKDFYPLIGLSPGDTVTISFSHKIANGRDGFCVLHILFLYENEMGQIYDTYSWTRYQLNDFTVRTDPFLMAPSSMVVLKAATKDLQNCVHLLDSHEDSIVWDPDDAKQMIVAFQQLARKPGTAVGS